MKIAADENVDKQIVDYFGNKRHEVYYICEQIREVSDVRSNLGTADKDFGELVFRQQLPVYKARHSRLHRPVLTELIHILQFTGNRS